MKKRKSGYSQKKSVSKGNPRTPKPKVTSKRAQDGTRINKKY